MDIFIALLKTLSIMCCVYYICYLVAPHKKIHWLTTMGRLHRSMFFLRLSFVYILWKLFHWSSFLLLDYVVTAPSYWLLKVIIFLITIIFASLFTSLFAKRLQDASIPGIIGLLWTAFIVYAFFYSVVQSTQFTFTVIISIITLIILFIPGKRTSNMYGPPTK